MSSFGIWDGSYKRTYVNDTSPPLNQTNLNYDQVLLGAVDKELERSITFNFNYLKHYYFMRNVLEINGKFMDYSDWTTSNCTASDETTLATINGTAVKALQPNATADYVEIYGTFASQDLAVFNDGGVSSVSDMVVLLLYFSDISKAQNIRIRLGDDSSNCYELERSSSYFSTGWDSLRAAKSVFSTIGSPTGWDNITYKSIAWQSTTGATNEYVLYQWFGIIRFDPDYTEYFNPFQYYDEPNALWVNDIEYGYDGNILYYDEKLQQISLTNTELYGPYELVFIDYENIYSFIMQIDIVCKDAGYAPSVTWRSNASNYFRFYIDSDDFTLYIVEGGTPSTITKTLSGGVAVDQRVYIRVEKHGQKVRGIVVVQNADGTNETKVIEYGVNITGSGELALGTYSSSYGRYNVIDILATHTVGHVPLGNWENNETVVIKDADEDDSSTTLQNDDELVVKLPPNGVYEVKILAFVDGTDNTTDLKTDWSTTNVDTVASKSTFGPGTGVTSVYSADAINLNTVALTTTANYGITTAGWARIEESAIVQTSYLEGTIQWRHAAANAGTVTVKKGSYIRARKISTAPLRNKEDYRTLTT